MPLELLSIRIDNSIAILELNRPPVNALNTKLLDEIESAVNKICINPSVKVVLVQGAGKNFAAGADIKEILETAKLDGAEGVADFSLEGHESFRAIETAPIPFIACMTGWCLGGGLELAMACDFRIGDETTMCGQPEIKLGIIPGFGGTFRLPRLIGRARAMHLLLTGDNINAAEAHRLGLIDLVAPAGNDAKSHGLQVASTIAAYSLPVIRNMKDAVGSEQNDSVEACIKRESKLFGACARLKDMREGFSAFMEKRPAKFVDK